MATVVGAVTSNQAVMLATEHAVTATAHAAVVTTALGVLIMPCPRLCSRVKLREEAGGRSAISANGQGFPVNGGWRRMDVARAGWSASLSGERRYFSSPR